MIDNFKVCRDVGKSTFVGGTPFQNFLSRTLYLPTWRIRKGYLKNQAPYCIIYSESESDTSSDLPSVEMFKE
jgi:hypothetical protein